MLTRNMHWIDRGLRVVVGAFCTWAGFWDPTLVPNAILSYAVGGFGVLNLLSALLAHCPVYLIAGISSLPGPASDSGQ